MDKDDYSSTYRINQDAQYDRGLPVLAETFLTHRTPQLNLVVIGFVLDNNTTCCTRTVGHGIAHPVAHVRFFPRSFFWVMSGVHQLRSVTDKMLHAPAVVRKSKLEVGPNYILFLRAETPDAHRQDP